MQSLLACVMLLCFRALPKLATLIIIQAVENWPLFGRARSRKQKPNEFVVARIHTHTHYCTRRCLMYTLRTLINLHFGNHQPTSSKIIVRTVITRRVHKLPIYISCDVAKRSYYHPREGKNSGILHSP